jgi:hypothetical protein
MTREEEIREAAKEFVFGDKAETSDLFDKVMIDSFYYGAKWADKTMLEKACEWLEDCAVVDIEEFKKAMEE